VNVFTEILQIETSKTVTQRTSLTIAVKAQVTNSVTFVSRWLEEE